MAVDYVVREGRRQDLPGLLKLVEEVQWSNVMEHIQILFDQFTRGIMVAESSDGEIISVCASVPLDDTNGQIALYITKKSCRGQGIGKRLFDLSIKTLGNRNVGVNAVWDKVDMYASVYFKIATFALLIREFPVTNFVENRGGKESSCKIIDIKEVDVDSIVGYDQKIHPMPRQRVLEWALGFASFGLVAFDGDEIKGWGTLHKSCRGYRLMPLYGDSPDVAELLAVELLKQVAGESEAKIQVCFPEDNNSAEKLYSNLGVFKGECTYIKDRRMFTERDVPVPSNLIFSILSENNALA